MDIGIDLGTTYSVIAIKGRVALVPGYPDGQYLDHCDVTIIPTPEGDPLFPSAFWANPDDPSEILIGTNAKEKAKEGEAPIMFSKRAIGTTLALPMGPRTYTAKEVATLILRYLKDCAKRALGEPVGRAVVTHPAYFDLNQVQETREAALAAGLDMALPEQMMMEPTAAALAYTLNDPRDPLRVMTYDLGGGTFDVAVLERREGVITMKGFDGDHLLGGYNFDRALVEWILARLRESGRTIPYDDTDPADRARRARLLQLAENTKFKLAEARNDRTPVTIKNGDILVDADGRLVQIVLTITAQQYAALIQEELDKTIACCHQALGKAGIAAAELDRILLVGGSTYGPWVRQTVDSAFGIVADLYLPDLCVAAGAALNCAELPAVTHAPTAAATPPAAPEMFPVLLEPGYTQAASPDPGSASSDPESLPLLMRDAEPTAEEIESAILVILKNLHTFALSTGVHDPTSFDTLAITRQTSSAEYASDSCPPDVYERLLRAALAQGETPRIMNLTASSASFSYLRDAGRASPLQRFAIAVKNQAPLTSGSSEPSEIEKYQYSFYLRAAKALQSHIVLKTYAPVEGVAGRPATGDEGESPDAQYLFRALPGFGGDRGPGGPQDTGTYCGEVPIPKRLGHFEIIEEVGAGAFSVVYLAKNVTSRFERQVALKFPNPQKVKREWLADIQRVAGLWKSLSDQRHPNIVWLEDLCTIDSRTFFVMEYESGGNLAECLRGRATKEKANVIERVLEGICSGLAFAHQRNIIHGDVKAQNILISQDLQRVKLADFGLAVHTADPGESAHFLGDFRFLSPEGILGERSFAADVYALGMTLYYLLTTDYPFVPRAAEDMPATDEQRRRVAVARRAFRPDFSQVTAEVPTWLIDLVDRCMRPDTGKRFANGQAVLDHVVKILRPPEPDRIVVTVSRNAYEQTLDFDLDRAGERSVDILRVDLAEETIKEFSDSWSAIGKLSLRRANDRYHRRPTDEIDQRINQEIATLSESAALHALGKKVREFLGCQESGVLRIVLDTGLADLPWELFRVGGVPLCRRLPMALSPKVKNARRTPAPKVSEQSKLRIVLVADPTGTLPGARSEVEALRRLFGASAYCTVEVVDQTHTDVRVRQALRGCDVLHFAGHGIRADGLTARAGLLLKGQSNRPESGSVFRLTEFEDFWEHHPPLLVFANACFSSDEPEHAPDDPRVVPDTARGLAQAMLSCGVRNYVGARWHIPDDATPAHFASLFYQELLAGHSVGQAMLHARCTCAQELGEADLTWARYSLFGEPWTRLPFPE